MYADVFSKVYNFHTIGLRYFNVFGPKQNPNNPYAAVIPIFCKCFIEGRPPVINGDGQTSRDFTFVENAVQANIKALLLPELTQHEVLNMACGDQVTLNEMIDLLNEFSGTNIAAIYGPERIGDVKHSKADIGKIKSMLGYEPTYRFKEGLELAINWYKNNKTI
jgi:UDP-N-acetylglucosamine 4-epimerase